MNAQIQMRHAHQPPLLAPCKAQRTSEKEQKEWKDLKMEEMLLSCGY